MKKKVTNERKIFLENWLNENYPLRNLSSHEVWDLSLLVWSRHFTWDERTYLDVAYYLPLKMVTDALGDPIELSKLYHVGIIKEKVDQRITEVQELNAYIEEQKQTIIYQKLVRDNIPDIILASGKKPIFHALKPEEYWKALIAKDSEELKEVAAAKNSAEILEELADKYEILLAMASYHNLTMEEIRGAALQKREKKGGFTRRLFLEKEVPLKKK